LLAKAGEPGRLRESGVRPASSTRSARRPSSRSSTRACDERCPSRSGWGEASGASNRDGRCRGGDSHRGPWPVRPRLASFCKGRHHPVRRVPPALPEAARDLRERFSAKRLRGSGDRAARARGLFWLQKSACIAWPLALPRRAGVPVTLRASGAEGARVDGRHPGPRKPWSLTRPRRRRAWRFHPRSAELRPRRAAVEGATEGVRGLVANSIRGRKRRGRGALFGGSVDRSTRQDRTALGHRSSSSFGVSTPATPPSDRVRPGRSSSVAVKRSSTRSVRWRLRPPSDRAEPRGRKASRGRAREPTKPQGARVVGRLQRSGRRIFPCHYQKSGRARREASQGNGDSLRRPAAPLDGARADRGKRQGAR